MRSNKKQQTACNPHRYLSSAEIKDRQKCGLGLEGPTKSQSITVCPHYDITITLKHLLYAGRVHLLDFKQKVVHTGQHTLPLTNNLPGVGFRATQTHTEL